MKMAKRIAKILNGIVIALLVAALLCNCSMLFARYVLHQQQPDILGYSPAVVVSGSMSGSIEINDLIIIHAEDAYTIGDVVTYSSGNVLVTHRIIGETENGFITKGDANNAADLRPVPMADIVGKVVLVVPRVGAVIEALRTPLGMTVLLGIALCMIFLPGRSQ